MDNKAKILSLIEKGLDSGQITESDLSTLLSHRSPAGNLQTKDEGAVTTPGKVSAVDIMFYIAGIVLFTAIIALINQLWDTGFLPRVLLSAGAGLAFWAIALYLIQTPHKSDIRRGLTNLLLLTGSLSLVAGGFIVANEMVSFSNAFQFYASAATLAVLGAAHISFGWQIRRDLITLIGVLLTVVAFPTLVLGMLNDTSVPTYVNCLIVAVSGGLLAYATRVASWVGVSSAHAGRAFDSFSAFVVLMSLYVASYDDGTGLIWLLALIAGIIGLFYLSIVLQDKLMLGNGSFFMVLAIITISFRYFSGYGVATSLLVGAIGLLGTAVVATTINRRYIK